MIIWVTVLVGWSPAFGQNRQTIDSLRMQLSQAHDRDQFRILTQLAFEYRYSNPDSAIHFGNRAYDLGSSLKLTIGLAEPLSFLGLASSYKGEYASAFSFYQQAIEMATHQNDSVQIAYGHNNLGRLFLDQGDFVRAYNNIIRAKDIFESLNDRVGLAYVYRSLSSLFKIQSDYQKAVEASQNALQLRQAIGEPRAITSALMELGLVQQAMSDKASAVKSFRAADSIATLTGDHITQLEVKVGIAELLFEDNKEAEAMKIANEVLSKVTHDTNQKLYVRASIINGKYLFKKGQFKSSLNYFNEVLSEANESGTIEFQKEATYYLSRIHKALGNVQLAKELDGNYQVLVEVIENTDLTRQIERLQFQLEIEKRERENELLKVNRAQNESLIAQQRFNNILLIIVVFSISIIALISITANRRRRVINRKLEIKNRHILSQQEEIARRNSELSKRNEELKSLNHEKDTLMNIVAHDLKSPLNRIQSLANLIASEKQVNHEYLDFVKRAATGGLDLITDLLDVNSLEEINRKPKISPFGIDQLLKDKINHFESMARDKAIHLKLENNVAEMVLTSEAYMGRILDNLVSNAIKFSPKESEVVVRCGLQNNMLVLSVRDQGPGFTEEDQQFLFQKFKKLSARPTAGESSNGLGLAIVKILVDRLGGNIRLKTGRNSGSEFSVEIPVGVEPSGVEQEDREIKRNQ